MKLRILLVPFFLVLAIGLIVWLVMPKYYDDQFERTELNNEKTRSEDMQKKAAMAEKLMVELSANADKQETLFSFLPEKQEEEEIINDLNNIAAMEAVSIKNLTLVKSAGSAVSAPAPVSAPVPGTEGTETPAVGVNASQSSTFNIDFTISGNYAKIKNVIDRLFKLKRFNKVSSINISKVSVKNEKGEEIPSDNLQAKIMLTFNYLKKADAISISSGVFTQESFDISVINKINSLRTIDILKINAAPSARSNPFLP